MQRWRSIAPLLASLRRGISCVLIPSLIGVDCVLGGKWQLEKLIMRFTTVQITSIPTLLAFSRQEPQQKTRVTSVDEMKDREFLRMWIEQEARRAGEGGAGGGGGLFGGLFGLGR